MAQQQHEAIAHALRKIAASLLADVGFDSVVVAQRPTDEHPVQNTALAASEPTTTSTTKPRAQHYAETVAAEAEAEEHAPADAADQAVWNPLDTFASTIETRIQSLAAAVTRRSIIATRKRASVIDVREAYLTLGIDIRDLHEYLQQVCALQAQEDPQYSRLLSEDATAADRPIPKIVSNAASLQRRRPDYIADFMPQFPDDHAYKRTPVTGELIKDFDQLHVRRCQERNRIQESSALLFCKLSPGGAQSLRTEFGHPHSFTIICHPRPTESFYASIVTARDPYAKVKANNLEKRNPFIALPVTKGSNFPSVLSSRSPDCVLVCLFRCRIRAGRCSANR
eukprot:m.150366 g.150366  ORF g.150366 m.150366 type:complete len:339 (+) comp52795_c0_seq12:1600-2616(+)